MGIGSITQFIHTGITILLQVTEIISICCLGKLHQERDNLMQQQRNAGSNAAALTGQTCKVSK